MYTCVKYVYNIDKRKRIEVYARSVRGKKTSKSKLILINKMKLKFAFLKVAKLNSGSCEKNGESVNGFIIRAIQEVMKKCSLENCNNKSSKKVK